MRKTLHTLLALLLLTAGANAQAPAGINYQLVVRDGSGNVLSSRAVSIRLVLRQGSAAGTIVFAENHATTTGSLGLVNVVLGNGSATTGTLAAVNWAAGPYFLETLIDQNGGSSYTSMGTQQLMSVPYALFSANAASAQNGVPAGGTSGQVLTNCNGVAVWTTGGVCPGAISALNCGTATNSGTLTSGTAASGVSSSVPYTGGNGGTHSGQTVSSTGVTGLTATLAAGTFASGAGSLTYTITGTPATSGTASFALNIGGQTCTLSRTVAAATPTYPSGTVHCSGTATAVVEVTNPGTGRIWMDRNLGASQAATSSTDANAYGDLYQWGRRADGHQCRNSATTSTLSSTDQPSHGNFILATNFPYDWRSPQNNNLWQGVSGTNNPCPSGYRIPTNAEWDAERSSWSSNNSAGAMASPLKLALAGGRSNSVGSLGGVGAYGYYWSSAVDGASAGNLLFDSSDAYMGAGGRAGGFSVRCLKD